MNEVKNPPLILEVLRDREQIIDQVLNRLGSQAQQHRQCEPVDEREGNPHHITSHERGAGKGERKVCATRVARNLSASQAGNLQTSLPLSFLLLSHSLSLLQQFLRSHSRLARWEASGGICFMASRGADGGEVGACRYGRAVNKERGRNKSFC